jgi:hypothetical protein
VNDFQELFGVFAIFKAIIGLNPVKQVFYYFFQSVTLNPAVDKKKGKNE